MAGPVAAMLALGRQRSWRDEGLHGVDVRIQVVPFLCPAASLSCRWEPRSASPSWSSWPCRRRGGCTSGSGPVLRFPPGAARRAGGLALVRFGKLVAIELAIVVAKGRGETGAIVLFDQLRLAGIHLRLRGPGHVYRH